MEIRKPAYFDRFRCLAEACPDSCCKEWAVAVDPESVRRYRELPGTLGDSLRAVMTEEDGDIILKLTPQGRCPMWRRDGLCRIQAQLGEEALCHTCREFPRLRHDYGAFVEQDLELSCPEAARLILEGEDTLRTQTAQGGEPGDYDPQVMELLLESRTAVLGLLSREDWRLGEALAAMVLYGSRVQNALDGGEPAAPDFPRELETARRVAAGGDFEAVLEVFRELEILTDAWRQRLDAAQKGPWREELRAVARYFVRRYWLQAVSDLDLMGRVKFIALSCLMIRHLGGQLRDTAQLYSKEIENNADNVDALLDGAYMEPALADIRLLSLLLEE